MRIHSKMLLLGLVLSMTIQPGGLHAQSLPQKFLNDASEVFRGTGHVLTNPLRWQGKDWAVLGSVVGGTIAVFFADEEVNGFFRRNQSDTGDKISRFGEKYGEPLTAVIATGGLYVIGMAVDSDWLRESCVILSAGLLSSGIVQYPTKIMVGRARPHLGLGHDTFDPFRGEEAYYSFFSGHTMVAMVMSHTFASRIDNLPGKIVLYSMGSVAGIARMYDDSHWLSDVVLGGLFAIVNVNAAAKSLQNSRHAGHSRGVQWRISPSAYGVRFGIMW